MKVIPETRRDTKFDIYIFVNFNLMFCPNNNSLNTKPDILITIDNVHCPYEFTCCKISGHFVNKTSKNECTHTSNQPNIALCIIDTVF